MTKSSKVVVIGAGASGISAAAELIKSGFENILLLEASERIGGRIHSIPFGKSGGTIDLGAQWVSGENEIYYLMKDHFEFGDTSIKQECRVYLRSNGQHVDREATAKLQTLGDELMFDDELKSSEETYGDFFKRKYFSALKSPEYQNIEKELIDQMLLKHEIGFNALFATASWNDVPAKLVSNGLDTEGSWTITWKKSGFKTVLDFLIKKLKETHNVNLNEKILFNKKVVNVNWESEKILVKCHDESEYLADHVITTIPLGVLKKHHQLLFTPLLPISKIKSIESIGFGTLGKVFLEFDERVFPSGVRQYIFLWSESDINEVRGSDKKWLLDVHGAMHVDNHPNLVEAFYAGGEMKEFETFPDSKILEDTMWLLEKFLGKKLKSPINMTRTRWLTDENFLGSYAYPSMLSDENSPVSLGKPVLKAQGNPVILFAGEATSKDHSGYVHGALESGRRVTQELIDYYQ